MASHLKQNDKYGSNLLKLKMNKVGRGAVRVWNKGGLKRKMPESWAGLLIQARVVIKSIWIQGRTFGLTLEITDAMVASEAAPATCAFDIDFDR